MIMEMIMYRLWVRGKSLTQDVAAENIVTTGQRSHLRSQIYVAVGDGDSEDEDDGNAKHDDDDKENSDDPHQVRLRPIEQRKPVLNHQHHQRGYCHTKSPLFNLVKEPSCPTTGWKQTKHHHHNHHHC